MATEIGSGRVGRSHTAEDPVRAAVVAHIRHNHTEYERILDDELAYCADYADRQQARRSAREDIREEVAAILAQWEGDGQSATPNGIPNAEKRVGGSTGCLEAASNE